MQAYLSISAGQGLSGKITTSLLQRVLKNAGVMNGLMHDDLDDITATLNEKPGYMNGRKKGLIKAKNGKFINSDSLQLLFTA